MATPTTALGLDGLEADTQPTDKYVPTYSDNTPIKWPQGSNPAHLPGILHELKRNYQSKGQFIALFENNAVVVGSKLAVDSVSAINFITGLTVDPYARGFSSPCPDTEARIRQFDAHASGRGAKTYDRTATPPDAIMGAYSIMPYAIRMEKGRLLTGASTTSSKTRMCSRNSASRPRATE